MASHVLFPLGSNVFDQLVIGLHDDIYKSLEFDVLLRKRTKKKKEENIIN